MWFQSVQTMELIFWLLMFHYSVVDAKNQSEILAKIDGHPLKLIYQTWLSADLGEEGEWKSLDGTFNCIEQDAIDVTIVDTSDDQMPVQFFHRYPDVESFEMTHKRLKSIQLSDLQWANSLLRLNVSHNEIDRIDAYAFESAPKLSEIDLSFNLLHDLNENMFTSYLIKYLYLHNNQLTVVNPLWFENLLYLNVLTLNNNRIACIDWRLVDFWPNINALHLHSNEIAELHNYQSPPRSMQTFSMHNNPVDVGSEHLIWMDVATIDVRHTGVHICRVSQRMSTLIAANNEIREINLDNLSAPNENALVTLDLANNHLQSIENVTHFHRLQYLNLSHNLLNQVEAKVFGTLQDLRQLDLSHNQLIRFDVENNPMPNLNTLDVSFNEILTLNLDGMMSQLENLNLNINGNRIKATDSVIKKRHTVNHETLCLADPTTCHADQTHRTTDNTNHATHPQQPQITNQIRDFIYEQFHIMEKNILELIDSEFKHIRRRVQRLEEEMIVITSNTPGGE